MAGYSCKALDTCQRCGACLMEELRDAILKKPDLIRVMLASTVTQSKNKDGGFLLNILQRPTAIHPELCEDCGKCIPVCPEPNALTRSGPDGSITLDPRECGFYKDESCRACLDACPSGAISLSHEFSEVEYEFSAVILATGFKPFDPSLKPRFGYGLVPGVMTSRELDIRLRNGSFDFPTDQAPLSAAFIQCVGSRDTRIQRDYCSQVCCGYAMRMARLLLSRFPHAAITIFYMDMQTYDQDFANRHSKAAEQVRLIRAMPSEIRTGESGTPVVTFHSPDTRRISESFDLVILSVGISPETAMAEVFHNELGSDGFFASDSQSGAVGAQALFVAGTAKGPADITRSIEDGAIVAAGVISHFEKIERGA